jgi:hypothetical protein
MESSSSRSARGAPKRGAPKRTESGERPSSSSTAAESPRRRRCPISQCENRRLREHAVPETSTAFEIDSADNEASLVTPAASQMRLIDLCRRSTEMLGGL